MTCDFLTNEQSKMISGISSGEMKFSSQMTNWLLLLYTFEPDTHLIHLSISITIRMTPRMVLVSTTIRNSTFTASPIFPLGNFGSDISFCLFPGILPIFTEMSSIALSPSANVHSPLSQTYIFPLF